jgi:hypothetical protein
MSDDLVKRLRKWDYGESTWGLLEDAADRIEKLDAALRLYACESTCPNCYGQVQDTRYCGYTARKALDAE